MTSFHWVSELRRLDQSPVNGEEIRVFKLSMARVSRAERYW
jgi:hypothetical protein